MNNKFTVGSRWRDPEGEVIVIISGLDDLGWIRYEDSAGFTDLFNKWSVYASHLKPLSKIEVELYKE